jgi:hypothetical protein
LALCIHHTFISSVSFQDFPEEITALHIIPLTSPQVQQDILGDKVLSGNIYRL